jgi:hypothetical protein
MQMRGIYGIFVLRNNTFYILLYKIKNMKKITALFYTLLFALVTLSFNQAKATPVHAVISYTHGVCCCGQSNGWSIVTPNGGTSPYTYSWVPSGGTDSTGSGLPAGSYTVTVTDNLGQTATAATVITEPACLTSSSGIPHNNTNCIDPNGWVTASPGGGTLPYTYLWMPTGQTNSTATGLAAGTYTCTMTDNNNCADIGGPLIITIGGTTAPILTITSTADTNSCDGTVSAGVTGGVSPFTYKWSPGGQTTASLNGLCAGTYCCMVTDHSGCKDSTCVVVGTSNHTVCCQCGQRIPTNIEPLNLKSSGITVYPNPNKGIFTIQSTVVSSQLTVEVYNMLGEKVYSSILPQTPKGALNNIDLSNRPNGVYLYRVISENGDVIGQGKLVIQK